MWLIVTTTSFKQPNPTVLWLASSVHCARWESVMFKPSSELWLKTAGDRQSWKTTKKTRMRHACWSHRDMHVGHIEQQQPITAQKTKTRQNSCRLCPWLGVMWWFSSPSSQPIYLPRWKVHSIELWCLCVGNVKASGSRMTTRSWEGAAGAGCRFPLEVRRSGIFVFGIKEMILMFEKPERSLQHSVWGTQTGKMLAFILVV